MLHSLGPGQVMLEGARFVPPILSPLITAAQRGEPLEPVVAALTHMFGFDSFMYATSLSPGGASNASATCSRPSRGSRFGIVERTVHWTTAISFCVLGVTGLTMLFGKYVLLLLTGHTLFGWLAGAFKVLYNFIAPLFIVSVTAMVLLFAWGQHPASVRRALARPSLGGDDARGARSDRPVQCRRERLVLVRGGGVVHRRDLEWLDPAVSEL